VPAAVAVIALHLDAVAECEAGEVCPGRHRAVDEGRVTVDLDADAVRADRGEDAAQVEPLRQAVRFVCERRAGRRELGQDVVAGTAQRTGSGCPSTCTPTDVEDSELSTPPTVKSWLPMSTPPSPPVDPSPASSLSMPTSVNAPSGSTVAWSETSSPGFSSGRSKPSGTDTLT